LGEGVFPQQRSPQVLWIGADEGVPHLTRLAECLNQELETRGYPVETKPYRPHLTLARMKTREGEEMVARTLPMFTDAPADVEGQRAFTVQDFALMESELHYSGPRYTAIKTFAFGAKKE
jgi:2'-5' RNA ligase